MLLLVNELVGETLPVADLTITDDCDGSPSWSSSDAAVTETDALSLNLAVDQTAIARNLHPYRRVWK